jgi:RNA polymerase sigma factor (sigma-70 family)
MTDKQKQKIVLEKLGEIYPQLLVNLKKTTGAGFDMWGSDLLSETINGFIKRPVDIQYKIAIEDNSLEQYLTRVMGLSLKSVSSSFYTKHRRFSIATREILDEGIYGRKSYQSEECDTDIVRGEENHNKIREYVENLPFYEKHLVQEHYFNNRTISDIAQDLGIQPQRITSDIKQILQEFKNKIQNGL